MNSSIRLLFTLFCFFLTACSSIPVSHDFAAETDFSALKSYQWQASFLAEEHKIINNNPLINQRIHRAIDEKLASLGYLLNDDQLVDFIVSYQIKTQPRLSSDGSSTSFTFGFAGASRFGAFGISSGDRIKEYDEQTLAIDIVSNQTNHLIWRGESTRRIHKSNSPEQITELINAHVNAILDQFPPGKNNLPVE